MKTYKDLMEKTLTPAELKKREEIAKAMEKENPGMNMGKKMAIATAAAKRVAESEEVEDVLDEGLGKDLKRLATGKDVKSRAGQEIAKSQDASMKGDNKTANKHFKRYDKLDNLANKGVAEGSTNKDMTGQTCEKCKKGKYQERSQHDDMQGKVTCKCGHRVDRWKKYKEQGVAEGFDSAAFDRHMDKLRAQKELEKTDPMRAMINKMKSDYKEKSKSKSKQDDERQITDPFHHSQGVKIGEQGVTEGLSDTQKKIEDTILKLEQRLKFAKTPEQWDNIKNRIDRLQAGLNRSKQGVSEGLSKRDQKDVDAIKAAIAGLQDKLKQPNADKEKIQQTIANEKKRLALYEQGVMEETMTVEEQAPEAPSIGVHRIAVTTSEPDHPAVSKRKETTQRFVRVTAQNKEKAIEQGKKHFKKKGYKVHGAEHVGMIHEEVELEEGTFVYHMNKAIAAHDRGDENKKKMHLDNAKTARYALKSTDITKHKDLLDKYSQMHKSVSEETMQTTISFKEFQSKLDEAVGVEHDRYMRSHGKKATGTGNWMFTHKRTGDVDYSNKAEVHSARGSFSDAKKSAQKWAKEHGHKTAYVMESFSEELDEAMSPQQNMDFERMMKGAMSREAYNAKWKKPLKSDAKVIYGKNVKEEVESIDEVNHREFAEAGKMHPTMARVMKTGSEIDFYSSENGDKLSGKVTKNDGKNVHVQANKDGKVGGGKTHKFAVSKNLNGQIHEENELDEADYDWSKVGAWGRRTDKGSSIDWNSDKKSSSTDTGTVHKAREVARNPEGGEVQKRGRGRPAGEYKGTYKARDPESKAASSAKAQASKADGLAARKEFKTSMDAAIRQRQLEIWKKASKAAK